MYLVLGCARNNAHALLCVSLLNTRDFLVVESRNAENDLETSDCILKIVFKCISSLSPWFYFVKIHEIWRESLVFPQAF